MKNIIILLTFLWAVVSYAVAPYGIKGQNQSATLYSNVHQFPNNQVTNLGGINALVETGNTNILVNPSFEHSTFDSGWTNNGTEVGVVETSDIINGKKSISFNPSAETINLTQSSTLYASAFADGVQGVAMCRIKSAVALSMCAIQNSAVSTTDCVTTSTDSRWSLYKIPFILGSTNNGVSIAGSALTGAVKVDDCFVGTANIIDTQPTIGPWTTFTPTGSWTANTTYSGKYRQVGESIEIQYFLTVSGAPTSATLTINMPTGFTINTSKLGDPSAGSNTRIDSSGAILDSGTLVYATLVAVYNSTTSLLIRSGTALAAEASVTQAAPMVWASGDKLWLYTKVPVTQFSGSTSTYTSQCGANCVDTFTAKVSTTGVVTGENVDWISGNFVVTGTSVFTASFNSGIFTTEPSCNVTNALSTSGGGQVTKRSASSSSVLEYATYSSIGASQANAVEIRCSKTGADFVATRTIQGSFKEVNVSPGITKPKTCHYAFGGAAATLAAPTECTTGTCIEVYDSCGTGTPPARGGGAGNYFDLTFASGTFAANSFIDCKCNNYDTTTIQDRECSMTFVTGDQTWSSNGSGGAILNALAFSAVGIGQDGYVQIKCEGSAP